MKRIGYIVLLSAVLATACDKVETPRAVIITPDFCETGIDDSIPNRKVLLEDYTGHTCGYCPEAGIYLNDTLKGIYKNCLIAVSVHAGFFAGTCPTAIACPHPSPALPPGAFETNFSTAIGESWNTFFAITGNPKGMINRMDYPSNNHSKTFPAWAPAIASQLELPAQVRMKITNNFNAASNTVSVAVESEFTENLTGDYYLQVVITEDSVIDWQQWYFHTPQYVPDFVHRHVLRDGLNTTWGEKIVNGNVGAGTTVVKNYNYVINPAWKTEHCSIVAFIYNDGTKEIIQAEEKHVR